ncbi:hypothetical protein D3C79_735050 [compost metagenome]
MPGTDQVAGVFVERAVQGQGVDLRQQLIQRNSIFAGRAAGQLAKQYAHAEGFGQARYRTAQFTMAEQAEGLALQFDDGEVQQAELFGLCPLAVGDGLLIVAQARSQRQQQGQGVLRHRRRAVALAIADHHTLGAGRLQVDIVSTGGGHQDQLQLGAGRQGGGVDHDLVADRHGCALQAFGDLRRRCCRVELQLIETGLETIQCQVTQVQGAIVEKHGATGCGHRAAPVRAQAV